MITRKNRVEPNLILQSVNNVTNCKGNKKEKLFFSVFIKYSQLIQPRLNPGFKKITGSGIKFLQQFSDQEVQRWVETATATEKRENTIEKYQQRNQASSSIPETTGFEIQTRDVRKPPVALTGPLKCNMERFPYTKEFRKFRLGC